MTAAKAAVAIVGSAVTAALGIWGPDTNVGRVLIVVSAALTAATVYLVPNKPSQ